MSSSFELKDLSHHAYLLIGSDSIRSELLSVLEKKHKLKTKGNPDFFDNKYEVFTIDDARKLKLSADTKPIDSDGKRIFVISMNGITVEAQNALLKLLEEPAEYVHFFLIVPSSHLLLPTVKSRLSLIANEAESSNKSLDSSELDSEAAKFLKMPSAKRLEAVKKLVEDISKEKKTKQDAIDFLNALQSIVYKEKGVKKGKSALEAIEKARIYMNDRAPSVKMLLEYVSLNI